jgi:hypothetical protein
MGYLHATPKDQPRNRMKEWELAGVTDFGLPELDQEEYLLWYFFDLWPTRSNGMADGPTDWNIILPYSTAKGLDDEDTGILADMCKGYHAAREAGTNPLAIEPNAET